MLSDNAKIREIHDNPVLHRAWVTLGREGKEVILKAMDIGTDRTWMEGVLQDALDRDQLNNRIVTVHCDCCEASDRGTEPSLKASGWTFSGGAEFCPNHK